MILYCHGGGFTTGSSYFYLEFLLAWATLLQDAGFRNPALLSVDYSLVPDEKLSNASCADICSIQVRSLSNT